jgi:hypothetical protein
MIENMYSGKTLIGYLAYFDEPVLVALRMIVPLDNGMWQLARVYGSSAIMLPRL